MGDRRYESAYRKLGGRDRMRVLGTLTDEEVVSALAAASRAADPYLANVLATAAHNRLRRAGAVMESIGEGLCILDPNGVVTHPNPMASQLLGAPPEDLTGRVFHALVHPEHEGEPAGGAACPLERALEETTRVRLDTSLTGRGGRFDAALTITPVLVEGAVDGHVVLFQDVTSRRRNEDLLRRQTSVLKSVVEKSLEEVQRRSEAEARFRQIFEANPDPVIVTDQEDRVVLLNSRAQSAFGCGPEMVGAAADVLLAPRSHEDARPPPWKSLGPAQVVHARRRDGSTFLAEVATSTVTTARSSLRITTVRDITARWMAEERLRRREELLSQAEEIAKLGSWEWDVPGGRIFWSNELYRIFGYAPGAVPVDMDMILAHVHPDDRATYKRVTETTRDRGEPFDFEHRILSLDGRVRTLHSRGSCIRDAGGRVVRVFGTAQDVTERRDVEATLRRTEARLHQVVETVAEGILIFDPEGGLVYANPAARVHPDMLRSRGSEWMKAWQPRLFHHADGRAVGDLRALLRRVLDGFPFKDVEMDVKQPDGRVVSLLLNAIPLREDGRPVAVLASFHDVTALHEARRRHEELNAKLEEKVARQTEMLRAANRELQAFSYTVSHDLQAPLRAIDYLVDELATRREALGPEGAANLERIVKEVHRMRGLVHDLLELSKLSAGEIHRRPVDVSRMARGILATLAERDPERRVETRVEDGLTAHADEALTRVLLENLLSNAWKYTSRVDGVARVEVGRTPEGAFFVRDNGAGFDPGRAGGLFKPFVRLHSRAEYEGTGIGLATVRRVVEKHGGNVWATGEPGRGATFFFTLGEPKAPPDEGPTADASPEPFVEPRDDPAPVARHAPAEGPRP